MSSLSALVREIVSAFQAASDREIVDVVFAKGFDAQTPDVHEKHWSHYRAEPARGNQ